jgi:hypothetical protein
VLKPKSAAEDCSLVVRTDFSDEATWQLVCQQVQAPQGESGFQATVEFISDKACAGLTPEAVCALVPGAPDERLFFMLVDSQTISNAEHPLLVVDTEDPGRTFRAIPSAIADVEPNLRLANMGFDDFEASLGEGGVYRGIEAQGSLNDRAGSPPRGRRD